VGLLHFTQVSFGGFLSSPLLGRASFHLSVIDIELERLLKRLCGQPHKPKPFIQKGNLSLLIHIVKYHFQQTEQA